jgi:hypothetical protein
MSQFFSQRLEAYQRSLRNGHSRNENLEDQLISTYHSMNGEELWSEFNKPTIDNRLRAYERLQSRDPSQFNIKLQVLKILKTRISMLENGSNPSLFLHNNVIYWTVPEEKEYSQIMKDFHIVFDQNRVGLLQRRVYYTLQEKFEKFQHRLALARQNGKQKLTNKRLLVLDNYILIATRYSNILYCLHNLQQFITSWGFRVATTVATDDPLGPADHSFEVIVDQLDE